MNDYLPFILLFVSLVVAGLGVSGHDMLPSDPILVWYDRAYYVGMFGIFASVAWIIGAAIIWWHRQDVNLDGE
jgi:hypothetical protein